MQATNFTASNGEYRNPRYQGQHEGETKEQAETRLHWVTAVDEASCVPLRAERGMYATSLDNLELLRTRLARIEGDVAPVVAIAERYLAQLHKTDAEYIDGIGMVRALRAAFNS